MVVRGVESVSRSLSVGLSIGFSTQVRLGWQSNWGSSGSAGFIWSSITNWLGCFNWQLLIYTLVKRRGFPKGGWSIFPRLEQKNQKQQQK